MNDETLKYYIALQLFFRKRMGEWRPSDWFYSDEGEVLCSFGPRHMSRMDVWLPLPIDPVNPERGLWGMIDWSRWTGLILAGGFIEIHDNKVTFYDTNELALLKALAWQEGVRNAIEALRGGEDTIDQKIT